MIGKILHLVLTLLIATACAQDAIDNTETAVKVDAPAGDFLASIPTSNSSENHGKSEDDL